MIYKTFQSTEALRPYIRSFWLLEGSASFMEPYVYRSVADGCAELVFHHKGIFDEITSEENMVPSFRAGLHAQSRHFRRFITHEDFSIFGVYIYPYALPALFNMAAHVASNCMPDLETIAGPEGRRLAERVLSAHNTAERIHILSDFMSRRLLPYELKDSPIHSAIRQVIHAKEFIPVSRLASQYNISPRQFERKFREYAGFTPKLFSRIIRFQATIKDPIVPGRSLTQLALDCGYYDQAHFIHDFKDFSGYLPKTYFDGSPEGGEWRQI